MALKERKLGALAPYRVLDLTTEGFQLCGRLLADLGADVIKIEPPGGDPTRDFGPFYHDSRDREHSLYWMAYNVNKRSITLNPETTEGHNLLERLVKGADFLIESFRPGYLDSLSLGYSHLSKINPRLVMVSITWYGQTGPKASYEGSELTSWADSGNLYCMGDPDRPPTWISFPHASQLAAGEASAGALTAHWHRETTGKGQHVDVAVQSSLIWLLQGVLEMWDVDKYIYKRAGPQWRAGTGVGRRQIFPCKDGYVAFSVMGGAIEGAVQSTKSLVEWMQEEGMAPDWLVNFDWRNEFAVQKLTPELVERVEAPFVQFLQTKTKKEVFDAALERSIILDRVCTAEEVLADEQLKAREFFREVDYPHLDDRIVHCGPFVKLEGTPVTMYHPAPRIGEHNAAVYGDELGISASEQLALKRAGAI